MQACDRDTPWQRTAYKRDLLFQRGQIGRDWRIRARTLGAACAEPTQPAAERHMKVKRDLRARRDIAQPVKKYRPRNIVGEFGGRWITRITRDFRVEQAQLAKLIDMLHCSRTKAMARRLTLIWIKHALAG